MKGIEKYIIVGNLIGGCEQQQGGREEKDF